MPPHTDFFSKTPKRPLSDRGSQAEDPIIVPAEVFQKGNTGYRAAARNTSLLKGIILLVILGGLLAGGGILLRYLASHPVSVGDVPKDKTFSTPSLPEEETGPAPVVQGAQRPPESADPGAVERVKQRAEQTMEDFVVAREDLDAIGGNQWGENDYRQMAKTGEEADAYFLKKEYGPATEKYDQALKMVRGLQAQSDNALNRLVEEGGRALDTGDATRARERFSLALRIDPASKRARQGMLRAEKTESVARFMTSGKSNEKQGNLAFALADYQEAVKLDPDLDPAREAFQRVKERIARQEFQRLMSTGFNALNREDYQGARDFFEEAQTLRPAAREAADALVQVDQAMRLARMKKLQGIALEAERSEDWEGALGAYKGVLEMDPLVQFAVEGKERCLLHIRLTKRMAFYLNKPEVLESDQYLEHAEQLLTEAEGVAPKGPRFTGQLERLDHLVGIAKKPLPVTLESDNFTRVVVYRVGRLGTFYKKDLALRPGSYTIVGMRQGYKDVRQQVIVRPGQPVRVTVICTERI